MKKIITMQAFSNEIVKEQKLTIGLDLGDRWSFYCVLDEAGKIILEQKVATTPEATKRTFEKIPLSLMALDHRQVDSIIFSIALGDQLFHKPHRCDKRIEKCARAQSSPGVTGR